MRARRTTAAAWAVAWVYALGLADQVVAQPPPTTNPADQVLIPGATFWLGVTDDQVDAHLEACRAGGSTRCTAARLERERPAVEVTVADFVLDRNEVTRAQYDRCVWAGVCAPIDETECAVFDGDDWDVLRPLPVSALSPNAPRTCVTRAEAAAYCGWVGGRLPREAEWELAAAGPDGRIFPWGDDFRPTAARFLTHQAHLSAVGVHGVSSVVGWRRGTGATPDGVVDLAGNAYEWVAEPACSYGDLAPDSAEGCGSPIAGQGVLRGGSFASDAGGIRTTYRRFHELERRTDTNGFRCAYDPPLGPEIDVPTWPDDVRWFPAEGYRVTLAFDTHHPLLRHAENPDCFDHFEGDNEDVCEPETLDLTAVLEALEIPAGHAPYFLSPQGLCPIELDPPLLRIDTEAEYFDARPFTVRSRLRGPASCRVGVDSIVVFAAPDDVPDWRLLNAQLRSTERDFLPGAPIDAALRDIVMPMWHANCAEEGVSPRTSADVIARHRQFVSGSESVHFIEVDMVAPAGSDPCGDASLTDHSYLTVLERAGHTYFVEGGYIEAAIAQGDTVIGMLGFAADRVDLHRRVGLDALEGSSFETTWIHDEEPRYPFLDLSYCGP